MESETINRINNIGNDQNEKQNNNDIRVEPQKEENELGKSNLDIATSSKNQNEITEENKENDQNSNKEIIQQSIDIKPKLRLVPIEKLLAPKLLTQPNKPTSQYLIPSNTKKSKISSVIILDDSDDDDCDNNIRQKSIKRNKIKLLKKNTKNGSDTCDSNHNVTETIEKPRPSRNLRSTKTKTIEKIRKALAASSTTEEESSASNNSDVEIVNDRIKKTINQDEINNKIVNSDSEDDIIVKYKTSFKSSSDKNNIVTSTPKILNKLTTHTNNNKDYIEPNESINVSDIRCNNTNVLDNVKNKKKHLVIQLKRTKSSKIDDIESQIEKYEIPTKNKEQLTPQLRINGKEKVSNKNENTANKKQTTAASGNNKNDHQKDNTIKSHISESDNISKKILKNKELDSNKELDANKFKSNKDKNSQLSTNNSEELLKIQENSNSSACENSNIDQIETVKQNSCIRVNDMANISEKTLLNQNNMKKLKIRLKRLSKTEMKKIIEDRSRQNITPVSKAKEKKTKYGNTKKRNLYIRGLSSSSTSESAVEEEEVIKKNKENRRRNTRRDSTNSNDNGDDNNKDDDSNKTKVKQPKSTTTMSSSEDDIIQQDEEDQSSDNDSNNSSELISKRTVTVRMKKSTQRSDEEYVVNSDDDDEEDNNIGNNMDKKNSDSDDDDDDYESDNKKKIKRKQTSKRKRIKNATDSSDDDEAGGSNKKRKNIRKLIKTKELNMDTKQAAQEEKDRRRRIEERQRVYNSIYEKPETTTELSELVLDFDENTKKPLLKVDSGLLKLLKPHQATGVKFMWDACYETLKDAEESSGSGCILAHCMGLGKTLQVIALTHTLLTNSRKTNVERVLIITPLSTLTNWAREYHHWMRSCKINDIEIYDMSKYKDKTLRTYKLNEWFEDGGVCIMGYDMFRILSNEKTKGLRKKQRETLQQCLVDPGADIVICDEGHLLKNEKTSISKAVTKMRTRRRIVLTGTPLQNNLKEYYCMIQFIKPNLLGTYKEYLNRFVNPITNGQYTDSTERDIRLMKHRSHILHTLLEGCLQRRDYSVLAPYLPPKHEYVIYITLTEVQKILYEFYMTKQRNNIEDMTGKGAKLFQDFQNLRRIWTHPMCLRVNSDIAIKKRILRDDTDSEGSLKDFIEENTTSASSDSDSVSGSFNSDKSVDSVKKRKVAKTRNQRLNAPDDSDIEEVPIVNKEDPSEWWCQMVPKEELNNINHSAKLVLLMKVLDECEQIGDKLLLFSQSLQSLDVIEEFLSFINRKTQGIEIDCNVNGFTGIWRPGVDYFRLDGSSSVEQRDSMCKAFNNVKNLRARLFLISTRAGSLGINLVAANRVIIFDVSWNPSHDTQSIFRVYRFGQEKPCYIYRFIAMGTMEQKVYERQVAKQAMAKRVIDEQQIGRHYNQNDLLELYTYELESKIPREIPILPKDRLFADLLANYEKLIYKYHEHDSLLENQESDNLSEEERKAAWDEYETEKNRPPQQQYVMYNRPTYTIGPGGYQAHHGPVTSNKIFGFRTDVLLRLLNMKVGRDHPRLTPNEIVQRVPSYLQQLYAEMHQNNPTMYKELLELHQQLEMPQGYYMNPLLYTNQNQEGNNINNNNSSTNRTNPYANRPPPTISAEIVEID